MDSVGAVPSVTFRGNASREPSGSIQSLPCRIEHTGPANVSNYFRPERHDNGTESVTFRGRLLHGTEEKLPDGYRLHVTKKKPVSNAGGARTFIVEGSTDSIKVWDFDKEPHPRNPLQKALAFVKIAEALASDD